jgi:hypothetical protein
MFVSQQLSNMGLISSTYSSSGGIDDFVTMMDISHSPSLYFAWSLPREKRFNSAFSQIPSRHCVSLLHIPLITICPNPGPNSPTVTLRAQLTKSKNYACHYIHPA